MIRINLVGKNAKGGAPTGGGFGGRSDAAVGDMGLSEKELQKQGILRLVVLLLVPVAMYVYESMTIPELKAAVESKTNEFNEMQEFNSRAEASVLEIKKFKEDEAKIQARIKYLEVISRGRQNEIRVLDLIQQVIPEKVWLVKLEFREGRLLLSGLAMSDFEISGFMESLAKSVFFSDVKLESSAEQVVDGLNLKRFEVLCQLGAPST